MSAINYLTYGERSVMLAKPASYQELKREIRKSFPMLASVSNIVILYKPKLENGTMLNHYVEVDPSAYSAIHDGAEIFINVAEPITKRYIFPLPDGSHSNVGPQNQVAHTDGLGNRVNPTMGGGCSLALDKVSNNNPKSSKYNYPGMGSSQKLERADGDACASGWADASERFRRSAKLIPDLKDCQEAVGLEVGESNCYPDEKESADRKWGHVQEENATNPVLTEKGWYTGTEDFAHVGRHDAPAEEAAQVAVADNTTVLPAGVALIPESDRHDETNFHTVGKNNPNVIVKSFWPSTPSGSRPKGASSPRADRLPSECSLRRGADPWDPFIDPAPLTAHQNLDGDAWGEKGSFFGPADHQRNWEPAVSSRMSAGAIWALQCENDRKDHADQQTTYTEFSRPGSYTYGHGDAVLNQVNNTWGAQAQMALPAPPAGTACAIPIGHGYTNQVNHAWGGQPQMVMPVAPPAAAPITPMNHGYTNQVSQDVQNYAGHYGDSGWSSPRSPYSRLQAVPPPGTPEFNLRPSYGSFTPDNPGWVTNGSPIAKVRRRRPSGRAMPGQERQNLANIEHHQAQFQAANYQQASGQQYNGQQLSGPLQTGFPPSHRVGGQSRRPLNQSVRYDGGISEQFWYAPPSHASNVGGGRGGGAHNKFGGKAVGDKKRPINKTPQDGHAGCKLNKNNSNKGGWGDTPKTEKW